MATGWDGSETQELCEIVQVVPIDWSQDAVFTFLPHDQSKAQVLISHFGQNHIELIPDEGSPCSQYYLPINDALGAIM